jgi:GNAT superfamily N-acetyltransferase
MTATPAAPTALTAPTAPTAPTEPTAPPLPGVGAAVPRQREDVGNALAVLTLAFATDPLMRWFWPEPARFAAGFPDLAGQMTAPCVAAGTLDSDNAGSGAALWFPPGAELPAELGERLLGSVPAARQADAADFLEAMTEAHPVEPHWYLALVGVDPGRQGQGIGSRLLATRLTRCDHENLPAYLEASSPRNRALYARHGFEVVGEISAGDVPVWPMWRPAR